jgi:AcrR family transcriptional regulator
MKSKRRSPTNPPIAASPRDRILRHAVDVLAAHGFDAMTMRGLGDAVGLDNSSLYRHFASKAELVHAVVDRVAQDALTTARPFLGPAPVTLNALEDLSAAVGLHFFDHPAAARLMVHWIMSMGDDGSGRGISVPANDAERPGGELLDVLRRWLERGVRSGALRRHAIPEALIVMLGVVVVRPATYGHLLATMEPKRSRASARKAWEAELRAFVRGAFTP